MKIPVWVWFGALSNDNDHNAAAICVSFHILLGNVVWCLWKSAEVDIRFKRCALSQWIDSSSTEHSCACLKFVSAYATSMTSVRLSITLEDCDHIVQRKVEIGTWQVRAVICMPLMALYRPVICLHYNMLWCRILLRKKTSGVWKKCKIVHICGIQRLACRVISASDKL